MWHNIFVFEANMKSFDILKISERARSSKLNLPLYNATAGMFFADDGNLMTYDSVRKTLEKLVQQPILLIHLLSEMVNF